MKTVSETVCIFPPPTLSCNKWQWLILHHINYRVLTSILHQENQECALLQQGKKPQTSKVSPDDMQSRTQQTSSALEESEKSVKSQY